MYFQLMNKGMNEWIQWMNKWINEWIQWMNKWINEFYISFRLWRKACEPSQPMTAYEVTGQWAYDADWPMTQASQWQSRLTEGYQGVSIDGW